MWTMIWDAARVQPDQQVPAEGGALIAPGVVKVIALTSLSRKAEGTQSTKNGRSVVYTSRAPDWHPVGPRRAHGGHDIG